MKRGRSVEPVRLRRRMGSAHGQLARADGETIESRTRRSTRSCGKVFLPAVLPAGRSPKSVRRGDGSPIGRSGVCKRALFVLDGKGVIFWSYCSPMARRGSLRSRICARALGRRRQPAARACCDQRGARRGEGSLIEGVEATRRLLTLAFERFRVRPIEALGKRFDPTLREAVAMEESTEAPGAVVGVVEDGYTINGRLLRPARVVQKPGRMPRRPRSRRNRRGRRRLTSGRRDDRLSAHPQNAA